MSNTPYGEGAALAGGSPPASVPGTPIINPPGRVNVDYLVSSSHGADPPKTFNGLDGAIMHARALLAASSLRHAKVVELPIDAPLTVTITETLHVPPHRPPGVR